MTRAIVLIVMQIIIISLSGGVLIDRKKCVEMICWVRENTNQGVKYIPKVYTFVKIIFMKTLSLKLDDKIFEEAEEITSQLHLARNRYINDAVNLYNAFNKSKMLKKKLTYESKLAAKSSLHVLHEFEKLVDED